MQEIATAHGDLKASAARSTAGLVMLCGARYPALAVGRGVARGFISIAVFDG
ncbi:MAG: hypothetical protein WKF84_22420 [Pyrinomonadaceae bacterium]